MVTGGGLVIFAIVTRHHPAPGSFRCDRSPARCPGQGGAL